MCLSPRLFFPEGPPLRQRALRWITQIPVTLSQSFDHRGYSDLSLLSSLASSQVRSAACGSEVKSRSVGARIEARMATAAHHMAVSWYIGVRRRTRKGNTQESLGTSMYWVGGTSVEAPWHGDGAQPSVWMVLQATSRFCPFDFFSYDRSFCPRDLSSAPQDSVLPIFTGRRTTTASHALVLRLSLHAFDFLDGSVCQRRFVDRISFSVPPGPISLVALSFLRY